MLTAKANWNGLLESLQAMPVRISIIVTGGGAGALARCFRRQGASRNFVDGAIPYSPAALEEYLGRRVEVSSVSPGVAQQLATTAKDRAIRLGKDESSPTETPVGIALTAALPTKPRRRGQDRIHVALRTHQRGILWSLELAKDQYSREEAEIIADEMIYAALSHSIDITPDPTFFTEAGLEPQQACFHP